MDKILQNYSSSQHYKMIHYDMQPPLAHTATTTGELDSLPEAGERFLGPSSTQPPPPTQPPLAHTATTTGELDSLPEEGERFLGPSSTQPPPPTQPPLSHTATTTGELDSLPEAGERFLGSSSTQAPPPVSQLADENFLVVDFYSETYELLPVMQHVNSFETDQDPQPDPINIQSLNPPGLPQSPEVTFSSDGAEPPPSFTFPTPTMATLTQGTNPSQATLSTFLEPSPTNAPSPTTEPTGGELSAVRLYDTNGLMRVMEEIIEESDFGHSFCKNGQNKLAQMINLIGTSTDLCTQQTIAEGEQLGKSYVNEIKTQEAIWSGLSAKYTSFQKYAEDERNSMPSLDGLFSSPALARRAFIMLLKGANLVCSQAILLCWRHQGFVDKLFESIRFQVNRDFNNFCNKRTDFKEDLSRLLIRPHEELEKAISKSRKRAEFLLREIRQRDTNASKSEADDDKYPQLSYLSKSDIASELGSATQTGLLPAQTTRSPQGPRAASASGDNGPVSYPYTSQFARPTTPHATYQGLYGRSNRGLGSPGHDTDSFPRAIESSGSTSSPQSAQADFLNFAFGTPSKVSRSSSFIFPMNKMAASTGSSRSLSIGRAVDSIDDLTDNIRSPAIGERVEDVLANFDRIQNKAYNELGKIQKQRDHLNKSFLALKHLKDIKESRK